MRHGSLFSGIGGFDLASEWMGWENVFHCEWNKFGQKVLKYYWPKAITYNDITKTDFSIHRGSIDIITGGFPCQPYSMAGKRLGKEDERHLWPEMLRSIREIQPTWVVGENVLGLVNWNGGLVFEEVQADLEAQGYEVQPYVLPAASVNAPHRRDRIWFVAYARKFRLEQCQDSRKMGARQNELQEKGNKPTLQSETNGQIRNASDPISSKLQGSKFNGSLESKRSFQRKSGQFSRPIFSKWEKFPTKPPICDGNDGIYSRLDSITFSKWRNESIKAGGNAIVPQVVYQIFKAIQQYNNLNN
jgi:DNA (cytosine-5)-methyltransferase 1